MSEYILNPWTCVRKVYESQCYWLFTFILNHWTSISVTWELIFIVIARKSRIFHLYSASNFGDFFLSFRERSLGSIWRGEDTKSFFHCTFLSGAFEPKKICVIPSENWKIFLSLNPQKSSCETVMEWALNDEKVIKIQVKMKVKVYFIGSFCF